MATKQGEEERATARPRKHGASVRQPWTQGGAKEEKTPGAVRERKSRGRTSHHAVTRGLQPAALARWELGAVLVRVTPNVASVAVSRGVRETGVVSDEFVRAGVRIAEA